MDVIRPEIEFMILADSVEAVNNKLYMLGGCFTNINSPAFPCPVVAGIAVGILLPATTEKNEYELEIGMFHGDTHVTQILNFTAQIIQKATPVAGNIERVVFAANVSLDLQRPGRYTFRATCGRSSKETSINAILSSPQS